MIAHMIHLYRKWSAKRRLQREPVVETPLEAAQARLQRIVDQAAQSPATIEYRIRRAAAKAGWRKRKGIAA